MTVSRRQSRIKQRIRLGHGVSIFGFVVHDGTVQRLASLDAVCLGVGVMYRPNVWNMEFISVVRQYIEYGITWYECKPANIPPLKIFGTFDHE